MLVYQSLVGKHGLGTQLKPLAEKKCHCQIEWIPVSTAGQLPSQLKRLSTDSELSPEIVWGTDLAMESLTDTGWAVDGVQASALLKGVPLRWSSQFSLPSGFVPFDMGVTTWILNKGHPAASKILERMHGREIAWADLLRLSPEKKWFGWSDPRLSSVGFHLLLSMPAQQMRGVRDRTRNVASGWSAVYTLFMNQEFPLVWSYTSSEAYHLNEKPPVQDRIALTLKEGNSIQVEGYWIRKGASKEALEFAKFLLSPEAQKEVPLNQWMYPARSDVALPEVFKNLPMPSKILPQSKALPAATIREWEKSI